MFIEFDKLLHFTASFALALFDPSLAIAAGFAKELFDAFGGGVASVGDLFADALGVLLGSLHR